jgi:hypothetical protein
MKRMRLVLVAAALCLAVIAPLAAPAYAWGGYHPYPYQYTYPYRYRYPGPYRYPNQYPYPNQYQYAYPYTYQYPNQYQYVYPNPYPYVNQYQYSYAYPYPGQYQYVVPAQPPVVAYPPAGAVPRLITAYGDYTRCELFGLHQANCFVPDASNSPNLGSIQMEPAIQIWGNCTPGTTMTQGGQYQCSKTGAGWFPN